MISERLLVYVEATHFPTTSLSWEGKGQREKKVWVENTADAPEGWINMESAH